jgi:hypothetical protein
MNLVHYLSVLTVECIPRTYNMDLLVANHWVAGGTLLLVGASLVAGPLNR